MTISTLSRYLRCMGAQISFISETRIGTMKAERRIKNLPLCNSHIVPSNGTSGGLWVLWGPEIKAQILESGPNLIVAQIEERGPVEPWLLLAVYGDSSRQDNP